jgi:hypothetical protein
MPAKLRGPGRNNPLKITEPGRGLLGLGTPHVLYANIQFGAPGSQKDVDRLLNWLPSLRWPEKRVLHYLKKHQAEFRRCLEWISNGSSVDLPKTANDDPERDEFWEVNLSEKWHLVPEVKFLQQHGLDHGGITLSPMFQTENLFNNLVLEQRRPRDPLDFICWYMLSLLMWDGTVSVSRCQYAKCQKFIHRPTARRRFCDSTCRAKNAMDKKTPEEKRRYMRTYRALPTVKRRQK